MCNFNEVDFIYDFNYRFSLLRLHLSLVADVDLIPFSLSTPVKSPTFCPEGGDVNFFELGQSFCIFHYFFFRTFLADDILDFSVTSHCNTFAVRV